MGRTGMTRAVRRAPGRQRRSRFVATSASSFPTITVREVRAGDLVVGTAGLRGSGREDTRRFFDDFRTLRHVHTSRRISPPDAAGTSPRSPVLDRRMRAGPRRAVLDRVQVVEPPFITRRSFGPEGANDLNRFFEPLHPERNLLEVAPAVGLVLTLVPARADTQDCPGRG